MTHPFKPGDQVLAYCRDSGGADQETSTLQQEAAIRQFCAANNILLARVFVDVARSGGSTAGRVQLDALLAYVQTRPRNVAGVVVFSLSRLARQFDDATFITATIRRAGLEVYSLEDEIPAGQIGRIVEAVKHYGNAQFRADLSANVRRGNAYMIHQHHSYGAARPPMGYKYTQDVVGHRRNGKPRIARHLEPDPDTGPLVVRAFALRAAGATIDEIHKAVNLYATENSYSAMFRNLIYVGTYVYNGERIEDFCTPLIDPAIWQAAQTAPDDRFNRKHPRRANSEYLLSGLLACGNCGAQMVGRSYDTPWRDKIYNYRYYACHQKSAHGFAERTCFAQLVPADEAEAAVMDAIRQTLCDPAQLAALYAAAQAEHAREIGEKPGDAARIEREISDTKKALRNVTEAIKSAGHSRTLILELTSLEARLESLETRQRSIAEELRIIPELPDLTPDQLTHFGLALWGRVAAADFRDQQLLLRQIVKAAQITRTGKDIDLKIALALSFGSM